MWNRLRWWLRRDSEQRELDEEIQSHLEIEARERRENGESSQAALLNARREFGNVTRIREETREAWGWTEFERLMADFRHGLRLLRKTPSWTAAVAATLTFGIGLSTAIFGVVYAVLLKPLPYPNADRLVAIWNSAPVGAYQRYNVNGMNWMTWREQSRSFEDIALARLIANYNLTGSGEPERLEAARTSANLFRVLNVQPLMGRVFTDEEQNSDAKVAVLSYGFWQQHFGGNRGILGTKILLNGQSHEVIGVMPPSFEYPTSEFELWTPLYLPPDELQPGLNNNYVAVGRLKPGVTVAQAQADLTGVMRRFADKYPATNRLVGGKFVDARVDPLLVSNTLQIRTALWVLFAAVGCLLLIGCLNLGIMLIARASSRAREIAIRAALGAGAGRLGRQMLAEVVPLSIAGAGGGIALALLLLKAFAPLFPSQIPRMDSAGLNGPVLTFAVAASVLVVLLAALVPARIGGKLRLSGIMQDGSRGATSGTAVRSALVVAQIAVTVSLLFAGTLFVRSLAGVLRVNPGFSTSGVLTMHLVIPDTKYNNPAQVSAFYDRVSGRVQSLPGVLGAGFVNRLPLSGIDQTGPVEFEARLHDLIDTDWRSATPGYFAAAGIPLVQGRMFNSHDRPGGPLVALIDDQLAHRVFGSANPLGQRVRIPIPGLPWAQIVGVVGHILNATPEQDVRPQVYWPESQRTQTRAVLVVRTAGKPETFTSAVVEQIRKEDPDQAVFDVRTMDEWLSRTLGTRDLITWLVAFFGGASLVLACLGLYGVVSYAAGLRIREFGIRLALGASLANIRRLVLSQAGKLALLGCALGTALEYPVGRAIRGLLYGVTGSDRIALLTGPALLIAVALAATIGPARRASKADPSTALRTE